MFICWYDVCDKMQLFLFLPKLSPFSNFFSDRKKIKGRGRLTYRPISRSRSRSRTPPHWRAEKRKTISLAEFEKLNEEKAKKLDEIERRAEERRRRHEVCDVFKDRKDF